MSLSRPNRLRSIELASVAGSSNPTSGVYLSVNSSSERKNTDTYSNLGVSPLAGNLYVNDGTPSVYWQYIGGSVTLDSSWNGQLISDASGNLSGRFFPRSLNTSEFSTNLLESGEIGIVNNEYIISSNGITNKYMESPRTNFVETLTIDATNLGVITTYTVPSGCGIINLKGLGVSPNSGTTSMRVNLSLPNPTGMSGKCITITNQTGFHELNNFNAHNKFININNTNGHIITMRGVGSFAELYADGSNWIVKNAGPNYLINRDAFPLHYHRIDGYPVAPVITGLTYLNNFWASMNPRPCIFWSGQSLSPKMAFYLNGSGYYADGTYINLLS